MAIERLGTCRNCQSYRIMMLKAGRGMMRVSDGMCNLKAMRVSGKEMACVDYRPRKQAR